RLRRGGQDERVLRAGHAPGWSDGQGVGRNRLLPVLLRAQQAEQHIVRGWFFGVQLEAVALEVLDGVSPGVGGRDFVERLAEREAKLLDAAVPAPVFQYLARQSVAGLGEVELAGAEVVRLGDP